LRSTTTDGRAPLVISPSVTRKFHEVDVSKGAAFAVAGLGGAAEVASLVKLAD
jgi:hypothetical protein